MQTCQYTVRGNYAVLQLDRGRANPINALMVAELRALFSRIREDESVKGVVLTGKEDFFSAGLDIIELFDYTESEFDAFWWDFMLMIHELASFPKPFVSAITGHSPAGGCVLAICSDYRVMAEGKYRIGLNEIPVGIIVPKTLFELYSFWIGRGKAYRYLTEGYLMSGTEALQCGLIDELVPPAEVLSRAESKMQQYLSFNERTWKSSKRNFREGLIPLLVPARDKNYEESLDQWWDEQTRKTLEGFIAALKNK